MPQTSTRCQKADYKRLVVKRARGDLNRVSTVCEKLPTETIDYSNWSTIKSVASDYSTIDR